MDFIEEHKKPSKKMNKTKKATLIGLIIILVVLSGCQTYEFRCDDISPSSIIDKMKIKTWDDCHDWLSKYCNMNVSKTYCEGLPLK